MEFYNVFLVLVFSSEEPAFLCRSLLKILEVLASLNTCAFLVKNPIKIKVLCFPCATIEISIVQDRKTNILSEK